MSQGRRSSELEVDAQEAEFFEGESALKEYATPEHQLLTDEIERTVRRAIESLPEDLRTAITLREIEGMSYEEMAEAMQVSKGTIMSRLFHARKKLQRALSDCHDEECAGAKSA